MTAGSSVPNAAADWDERAAGASPRARWCTRPARVFPVAVPATAPVALGAPPELVEQAVGLLPAEDLDGPPDAALADAMRLHELRHQPPPVPVTADDAALLPTWRALRRVQDELSALVVSASAHPLAILRGEATRAGCVDLRTACARAGGRVRVVCLLAAARRVATRRGAMRFLTLEDETDLVEGRLAPATYCRLDASLTTPGPCLVEGRAGTGGEPRLEIGEMTPFHR